MSEDYLNTATAVMMKSTQTSIGLHTIFVVDEIDYINRAMFPIINSSNADVN